MDVAREGKDVWTKREPTVQKLWVEFVPQMPSDFDEDWANLAVYRGEAVVENSARPGERGAEKRAVVKGDIEDGALVGFGKGEVVWPDLSPPLVRREKDGKRVLEKGGAETVLAKKLSDYDYGMDVANGTRWCARWSMEELKENPERLLDLMVTVGWDKGMGKVLDHPENSK